MPLSDLSSTQESIPEPELQYKNHLLQGAHMFYEGGAVICFFQKSVLMGRRAISNVNCLAGLLFFMPSF